MLEEAIITGPSLNWFAYFHLGVMRHHAGDFRGAQTAWEHSVNLTWSAWAVRCLGIVAWHEGRFDEALGYLLAAYRSQPDLVPLAVECGKCMIEAEQYQLFFQFFHDLPTSMQTLGRMRLLNAQSALKLGYLIKVKQFFDDGVVVEDLREGEKALSDLWFEYHKQLASAEKDFDTDISILNQIREDYQLPPEFDFRMKS
ncbi:MAG: hypothetical protein ACK2U1_00050 [Anaerolineales bacterium]